MNQTTYSPSEIRWLLEDYEELVDRADTNGGRLLVLLKLADLHKAIPKLSPVEREAVVLCGWWNMTARAAGEAVGKDASTMNRRYRRGTESLRRHMNGGGYAP